jgi:REP element-mobilizing transposase RayT
MFYEMIIITMLLEALKHRFYKNEVTIYAFVIMPNHFHAIWQIHDGFERGDFSRKPF